jgi:hypothetical protein
MFVRVGNRNLSLFRFHQLLHVRYDFLIPSSGETKVESELDIESGGLEADGGGTMRTSFLIIISPFIIISILKRVS